MALLYADGRRFLTMAAVTQRTASKAPAAGRPMLHLPLKFPKNLAWGKKFGSRGAKTELFSVGAKGFREPRMASILAAAGGPLEARMPSLPPMPSLLPTAADEPVPFEPIGVYKPLTILIREVWTGKYPHQGYFQHPQSLLLTSAMKGILTTAAAPRALNFITGALKPHTRLLAGSAAMPGTPLVCYVPAVTEGFYSLTLELGFNTFDQDLFNGLASIFQQAAMFPVFMPAAPYLLAANTITKVAGNAGHLLFNTGIVLSQNEPLQIAVPGSPPKPAGYYLVVPDSDEGLALAADYRPNKVGSVVNQNGDAYDGDVPYIVISLDGTKQGDEYKNFTPLAATAEQLSTFFNLGDNSSKVVTDVVQGLQLVNDLRYRLKADHIQEQLEKAPNSPEVPAFKAQLAALLANIQNPLMKPAAAKTDAK